MASDALTAMLRSAQRKLAQTDVATFIEYVTHQEPYQHHLDMINFAIDIIDRKAKGVVLEPRGAGKTTILTIGFLPWLIATRPDIRIGLFSQKDKKAEAMSQAIMDIVSSSPEFIEIFGNLRGTHKWTASEWLVKNSPHWKTQNRTIVTGGAAQSSGAVSKRFDLLLLDDVLDENNTATIDQREKIETWFWKTLKPAQAAEGCAILVIGCLATGTPVLMADGTWRPIEGVRVGEQVWSVDETTLAAGPRAVEAVLDQGIAQTYRISTRTSTVEATGQHPFLAWGGTTGGRKTRGGSPSWKRADEIEVGDYLVEVKQTDGKIQFDWMDEEFCWLLGFLFGDGWLTRGDVICCALGSDEAMNRRLVAALESWFPTVAFKRTPFGYVRGDNTTVVGALRDLGFNGTAKTKRLPEWLFRSPASFKQSFLRGLCDADGHSIGASGMTESEALELANQNLIEDVRRLALTCGIRPSGVTHRTREGHAPHSKTPTVAESWRVHLNLAKAREMELGDGRSRHTTTGDSRLGMNWRLAKVKSVEVIGEQQVWDLTVEGTHTFIADGLAVHNTRWTEGDLYQQLIEVNKWDSLVIPAILDEGTPDERSYWPKVWPLERLAEERKDVGWDNFACSYMNSVTTREGAIFKGEWWRETYFDALPKDRTYTFTIGIDLATSVKERADYTAGCVVARDSRNEWWVLHHARIKTDDGHKAFVQGLWDWCAEQGYPVSRIIMESNQAQEAIVTAIQRQTPLPVIGRRTDVDKRAKARGAATFYESHRVHHHTSLKGRELESELRSFDKGHDDLVDALCLAMDITGHSGTTLGVNAPSRAVSDGLGGIVAEGSLLPFADGARDVPAHLAQMLRGIPTETLTWEEAVQTMNAKRLNDYIRSATRGIGR